MAEWCCRDEVDSNNQESPLFSGPKRLAATAAKYMSPFKEPPAKRGRRDVEEQALVEAIAKAKVASVSRHFLNCCLIRQLLFKHHKHCCIQSFRQGN